MSSSSRLTALDGLRGVAALVVVLYHLSLVARPVLDGDEPAIGWTVATETPLKLAFAGTEAVLVFFALSGLVVALPALRSRERDGFSWAGFFASRLVRLYVPVWGSLVFATALIFLIPRTPSGVSQGEWITRANATDVTWASFFAEASLTPASYNIVNVLWSLRWELAFALLLPVFIAVALAVRKHVWIAAVGAMLATIAGRLVQNEALVYLPVFLLGTLVAVRLDDVREWAAAKPRRGLWVAVGTVSGLLLVASWIGRPLVGPGTPAASTLWGLAGVGAIGVILLALGSTGARRVLDTRPAQWLGRVSFSLYLVHVPIIATLTFVLGEERWWLVALITVPLSLVTAAVFFRIVERPAHLLARRTGTVVGATAHRIMAPRPSAPVSDRTEEIAVGAR